MNAYGHEIKVIDILKGNEIDFAATLPCDRIKALLPLIDRNFKTISLTREENGVGICAGSYLGGGKPLMVIQSTGLGNMLNALLSLNMTYGIPLPILASWRGVYKEAIEAQWQFGKKLPSILSASGIDHTIINSKDDLEKIDIVIRNSFRDKCPHVALISPAVWEGSICEAPEPAGILPRISVVDIKSEIKKPVLKRYEAIEVLASAVTDEIVIANLGVPAKELYHIRDRELNFYMTGSMGLASSIGMGLAMAQQRHVYVIDGDGSILMNPNVLIGIGSQDLNNLTILAIDNAAYGSTGNQETPTSKQIDLEIMAQACGIKDTVKAQTKDELKKAIHGKVKFIHAIVMPYNMKCKEIPLTARDIKERFIKAIVNA